MKTKHVLVENELKKLKTFDSSLFIGQSYFSNDGAQFFNQFKKLLQQFWSSKHNLAMGI